MILLYRLTFRSFRYLIRNLWRELSKNLWEEKGTPQRMLNQVFPKIQIHQTSANHDSLKKRGKKRKTIVTEVEFFFRQQEMRIEVNEGENRLCMMFPPAVFSQASSWVSLCIPFSIHKRHNQHKKKRSTENHLIQLCVSNDPLHLYPPSLPFFLIKNDCMLHKTSVDIEMGLHLYNSLRLEGMGKKIGVSQKVIMTMIRETKRLQEMMMVMMMMISHEL